MRKCKYKVNIKDIQNRYKFKIFMRSGADIPKSITDDISSIKSSNEELKRSIEALKSETNKIIEENIKKKSQNQNMYNSLKNIYINKINERIKKEKVNLYKNSDTFDGPDWINDNFWKMEVEKFDGKYNVRSSKVTWNGIGKRFYLPFGIYKISFWVKADKNTSISIFGMNNYLYKNFDVGTEWEKKEVVYGKTTSGVEDYLRVEKRVSSDATLYISHYELYKVNENQTIPEKYSKIKIKSQNLLNTNELFSSSKNDRNILSLVNNEMQSANISSWNGMVKEMQQVLNFKKDQRYYLTFDIKGISENADDFNKFVFLKLTDYNQSIDMTTFIIERNFHISRDFQRITMEFVSRENQQSKAFFVQHNGNKVTNNQYIIRNIMLSTIYTEEYSNDYFEYEFNIKKLDTTDEQFVKLIDIMIDLDLQNKKYTIEGE